MGKITNPLTFSSHFKISKADLDRIGVFDPILNADTKLFIDPTLLEHSRHKELRENAVDTYQRYFHQLHTLLRLSKKEGDVPWRNALRMMAFHEFKGTCLGYGAGSIEGSGWGRGTSEKVMRTAKEIVDLGIDDPHLFTVLALIEDGIGADRISDMVTRVIIPDLIAFTERVCDELKVTTMPFSYEGKAVGLPLNPTTPKPVPVVLVPFDVLRDLPVASDWSEVGDAAYKNSLLRGQVNSLIGKIWEAKTRKQKDLVRTRALKSKEAFDALLRAVKEVPPTPYDAARDEKGHMRWAELLESIAASYPLSISRPQESSLDELYRVVRAIIDQFRHLVENMGLWKEFWSDGRPRPEKSAQRLFFATAYSYCKANDLDITPEAETGNGPVDFKFSKGFAFRVVVEIKLSTNGNLIIGYSNQLAAYRASQETTRAIYLVADLGNLGKKGQALLDIKNSESKDKHPAPEIDFVDASPKKPASKRRETRS